MSPIDSLRMNLRNSLQASDDTVASFAREAGVSIQGLRNFLDAKNPTRKRPFISKIENAMIRKNWKKATEAEPVRSVKKEVKLSPLIQKLSLCATVLASNVPAEDKEKICALILQ